MKKNADKMCSPMNQGQIQEFLFGGLSCNTSVRLGSASVFFSSRFLLFFSFFCPYLLIWETIFTVMNSVYTVHILCIHFLRIKKY